MKSLKGICVVAMCIFILSTITCQAGDKASAEDVHNVCKSMSEFSETVMQGRQAGVSMSAMIEVIRKLDWGKGSEDPILRKMMEDIIAVAYGVSMVPAATDKATIAGEFRDQCYLTCVKEFSE